MKKFRTAICLFLCIAVVIPCVGCFRDKAPFVPTSAEMLWKKIDQTMNVLDSYEANGTLEVVFYNQGVRFDAAGEVHMVQAFYEEQPYEYTQTTTNLRCDEYSYRENQKQIQAYYKGKAYFLDQRDDKSRRICSKVPYEDFLKMTSGDAMTADVDLMACTDKAFNQETDGTWSLKLSGYTKKTLDVFLETVGMDSLVMSEDVQDMEITITADALFRVQKLEYALVFSKKATAGTMLKVNYMISKYNEAAINSAEIKTQQYTEVEHIQVMFDVEDQLEQILEKKSGKINLDVEQTLTRGEKTQDIHEKYQIAYGQKNGSLFYNIEADSNNAKMTVSYENGVQTTSAGGKKETSSLSDNEAETVLESLGNYVCYQESAVSNIQKVKDNEYRLTMSYCAIPGIEELFTSNAGFFNTANQTITVRFENGKLTRMETDAEANGSIGNLWTVLKVHAQIVYKDGGGEAV